jgi:hypothetical protein
MDEKEKLVARYMKLRGGPLHNVATASRRNSGEAYDSEKFRYLSDRYSEIAAEQFEGISSQIRDRIKSK